MDLTAFDLKGKVALVTGGAHGIGFSIVFPKEHGSVKKKIGNPDLMILFTNTVSHKMVITASQEAKKNNIPIARIHTSSATALRSVLDEHCAAAM